MQETSTGAVEMPGAAAKSARLKEAPCAKRVWARISSASGSALAKTAFYKL